ncbi:DUF4258 domain-containing protein [Paenibacillus peoriae]|uniref:DUF4258 domain-containing protein n=1 Tax=Paenibacillus peoriae TaxID=59893 RepID=A0A7H0Y350_9BACL|nr:DUF4258 domain-containing protein [Paenibacillus peoriae]QNR65508.1 DUF4258 domain-containing protein [Paenibacillus peoriae]
MNEQQIISKLHQLALDGKYVYTKHARIQMIKRNLTESDVYDVLCNIHSILRTDADNLDGIISHKIEGGNNNHRLAIKVTGIGNETIVIITVMDKQ